MPTIPQNLCRPFLASFLSPVSRSFPSPPNQLCATNHTHPHSLPELPKPLNLSPVSALLSLDMAAPLTDASSSAIPLTSPVDSFTAINIEKLNDDLSASSMSADPVALSSLNDTRSGTSCNTLRVMRKFFGFSVLSVSVTVIVFLIGVGIAIGLFFWFRSAEIDKFNTFFLDHCEDQAIELKMDLQRNLATLADISALASVFYPNLNQSQLSAYAKHSSWNSSEIRHIMFGLRVQRNRRADWERDFNMPITARNYDTADPSRDTSLRPIPVPELDIYYPTILKVDEEEPKPWLGDDLHAAPITRAAIEKVQQTRLPAISGEMPLVSFKKGIFIIHPINVTSPYVDSNNGILSGFMMAAYDVNHIFSTSFARSSVYENMHVTVFDRSANTDKPLFETSLPSSTEYYDSPISVNIDLADRQYEIVCKAIDNDSNASRRNSVLSTIILVLALLVALLISLIAHVFVRKYEMVRKKGQLSQRQLLESQRILDSLARYSEAIVKFLPDPLLFVGDGNIKGANNHFLRRTGYELEDLVATSDGPIPVTKIIPSFHRLRTTSRNTFEADIRRADGTFFPAEISMSEKFRDSSNQMPRYVMLIRDLTERRKVLKDLSDAKCEAQKANQSKTEILYFLCHEIRNPVHVILGLCSPDDDRSNAEEANHGIFSAAKFLGSLVDDILSLLNVRAGLLPMKTASSNLKEMIDSISENAKLSSAEKSIQFAVNASLEDINVDVVTDEYRLRRSLLKIIEHSIRVAPSHGKVTFSVDAISQSPSSTEGSEATVAPTSNRKYRFTITDNSDGYSASDITKIFDPFDLNVSASQGKDFGGVGLGLALANQFLNALGAQLKFSSTKGRGNHVVIEIEFPVMNPSVDSGSRKSRKMAHFRGITVDTSPQLHRKKTAKTVPQDGDVEIAPEVDAAAEKPPKVLLVEDNAIVQKVTAKLLRKAAFEVVTADNGQEAIDIILKDNNTIDVVLMDLIMPVLSGHDATVKLRELDCQLPIIAVTANALDTEFERCKEEGFDDFVTKPATGETLKKIVHTWTGYHHES
ncbi:hypothetical protein BKA69DRAFT_1074602 [Paraphysoderma sedebokerense]|nr:hypothetical protein BKA69DRAFT_1074602 [Paraphysoderma sedebokerense]